MQVNVGQALSYACGDPIGTCATNTLNAAKMMVGITEHTTILYLPYVRIRARMMFRHIAIHV